MHDEYPFNAVLVIFPQSNLKNRQELEYSPKIPQRTLNTVQTNFLQILKIVHVIKS
jgi:hypothetical protein